MSLGLALSLKYTSYWTKCRRNNWVSSAHHELWRESFQAANQLLVVFLSPAVTEQLLALKRQCLTEKCCVQATCLTCIVPIWTTCC